MSAVELEEFLAAMEIVRQANTAWPETACDLLEQGDDLDEDDGLVIRCRPVTLH